jgi:RIO-like serine/threonine protein kinase
VERRVLQAFEAIHALHVVHGDVRPANVLVGDDGMVWVVDFEFSSIVDDHNSDQFSSEMSAVKEMLRVTKLGDRMQPGCLQLPGIGSLGSGSSLQVH